ncbi:MAG: hypothetical protein U9O98_06750 [Asgard group archaeon]|nr:hypothetical protein [Asgard group archaeon]
MSQNGISLPAPDNSLYPFQQGSKNTRIQASSEYSIKIVDFTYPDFPIYVNYTKPLITILIEGPEAAYVDVEIDYSKNKNDWKTVRLNQSKKISETKYYYYGTFGPFEKVGEYYMVIKASQYLDTLASIYTRFHVESVVGLLFTNFNYTIETSTDDKFYSWVYITIVGQDLDAKTVKVNSTHKEVEGKKMDNIPTNNRTFRALIGALPSTTQVPLIFSANTTDGRTFNNTLYFLKVGTVYPEESFLTSKLPAILAVVSVMGIISFNYFQNKRKPPEKFEK